MDLNPSQAEAAAHAQGPCLVLAGPGSGKTVTITKRTEYLITRCGVPPSQILVVTFTKAAAKEMQRRFEQLTAKKYPGVSFGTFHAVFFTILRHAYHYCAENIAREEVKYQFMREIIKRNRIECEDESEFCANILSEISALKNSETSIENYYPIHCGRDVFRLIYREYARSMHDHRLIDFDDILVYTKELLEQRMDIRAAWQKKYAYIMVDEFQDINRLQYQTVRLLAGDAANLFVVGDDDQSIYRFRGSRPELMLNFPKDYPSARLIYLSVNYRCPKEVVDRAGRLIAHNHSRFEKQIESAQAETGWAHGQAEKAAGAVDPLNAAGQAGAADVSDSSFVCRQFENMQEENTAIINLIRSHIAEGGSFKQVAVLYRTNTQPGALIAKLIEYNLPFRTKERIPNIYDHWIAQDLMAYFRLALGSRARSDFLRIMNRPKRYISRESLAHSEISFDKWQAYYEQQPWIAERIEQLFYDLQVMSRVTPYAAVNYMRKGIGYDDYLTEYAKERQIPIGELFETLDELAESTKEYKQLAQWLQFVDDYTKQLRQEQERNRQEQDADSISIMTLHAAKGLEYDLVIMPDVNEGLIPYKKAVLEAEIEEERRMMYVGMTRAKKLLHISYVKKLRNKEAEPSCFLSEIL